MPLVNLFGKLEQNMNINIFNTFPFYSGPVEAGFPSPANDHIESSINLNDHLILRPAATFITRAKGRSMIGAGIYDGDLLIVDRSLEVCEGCIVIAALNNELTVKRVEKCRAQTFLVSENKDYPKIEIREEMEVVIWGVVTNVIHKLYPPDGK